MAKAQASPASGIAAEILASVQNSTPGFRPWIDRVDATIREELEAIRSRYCAGQLDVQQKALAKGILKALADRNFSNPPSLQVVCTWLRSGR